MLNAPKLMMQEKYTAACSPHTLNAGISVTGTAVLGVDHTSRIPEQTTSVVIPEGTEIIGDDAFSDCKWLRHIILPHSIKYIGNFVFQYCVYLHDITIPQNVEYIGDGTFEDCGSLASIIVEVGNTKYTSRNGILFDKAMDRLVRYPAGKRTTAYTVPKRVSVIAPGAFEGCHGLKEIRLHDNIIKIGEAAFQFCDSLVSMHIPKWVNVIEQSAFSGCISLKNVKMPDGIAEIEDDAFLGTAIEKITVPSAVTRIGNEAFANCENLQTVAIKGHPYVYGDTFSHSHPVLI